jgi:large subunit ribosomal protein L3
MKNINKGLLTKKIGMTKFFLPDGSCIPVTVLKSIENEVIQIKTTEKDGYNAIKIGYTHTSSTKLTKPIIGQYKSIDKYYKKMKEFRLSDLSSLNIASILSLDIFEVDEKVNAKGITKGRGFTGTVKRHNFSISPMAHGSKNHRRCGTIGAGTGQAKVWKGQKMPGHYGNDNVTIKNLKIMKIDCDKSLILIRGSVPGSNGTEILIYN